MTRIVTRIALLAAATAMGVWAARTLLRSKQIVDDVPDRLYVPAISGVGEAVDHTRAPGVPPEGNDDYDDYLDHMDAASFPASDPPAVW